MRVKEEWREFSGEVLEQIEDKDLSDRDLLGLLTHLIEALSERKAEAQSSAGDSDEEDDEDVDPEALQELDFG